MLVSKWFFSELYQIFTPFFILIPFGLLFLITIGLGVWAAVLLVKRWKTEKYKAAIPMVLFVCILSIYRFASFVLPKVRLEHVLYEDDRDAIVADIRNNEYTDDGIGNVNLPFDRRYLSCDGEAHVYQNNEQGTIIGFWSSRGLVMNPFQSVIYTSYAKPPTPSSLGCGKIYGEEKLDENWYWIEAY